MRNLRFRFVLPRLRAALVGVLAIALVGLAPQLATASDDGVAAMLAAGAICSADAGAGPHGAPPVGHQHAHCQLCQTGAVPFLFAGPPALRLPASFGRVPAMVATFSAPELARPLPYASRAPPVRG